jgi:hypothetical protein
MKNFGETMEELASMSLLPQPGTPCIWHYEYVFDGVSTVYAKDLLGIWYPTVDDMKKYIEEIKSKKEFA